jgi:hypothetical protein
LQIISLIVGNLVFQVSFLLHIVKFGEDKLNIWDDISEYIIADFKFKNSKELKYKNTELKVRAPRVLKLDISKYFKDLYNLQKFHQIDLLLMNQN